MALREQTEAEIKNRWYELQDKYQSLADELHRLLDKDERFPRDAVYAVKHRLKSISRLVETQGLVGTRTNDINSQVRARRSRERAGRRR